MTAPNQWDACLFPKNGNREASLFFENALALVPLPPIVLETTKNWFYVEWWKSTGSPISKHRKGRKMKKKQLIAGLTVLILAAAAFVGFAPVQAQQGNAAKPLITVMNPVITSKMVDRTPLSPRLDTLDGKTLYLVDISWGGPEAAYSVFEETQAWFAQNKPSTKIVIKRKTGMYTQDDPKLWAEIKQNGNAALIGISG